MKKSENQIVNILDYMEKNQSMVESDFSDEQDFFDELKDKFSVRKDFSTFEEMCENVLPLTLGMDSLIDCINDCAAEGGECIWRSYLNTGVLPAFPMPLFEDDDDSVFITPITFSLNKPEEVSEAEAREAFNEQMSIIKTCMMANFEKIVDVKVHTFEGEPLVVTFALKKYDSSNMLLQSVITSKKILHKACKKLNTNDLFLAVNFYTGKIIATDAGKHNVFMDDVMPYLEENDLFDFSVENDREISIYIYHDKDKNIILMEDIF